MGYDLREKRPMRGGTLAYEPRTKLFQVKVVMILQIYPKSPETEKVVKSLISACMYVVVVVDVLLTQGDA